MEHLTKLWREKETSRYLGRLFVSYESFEDFKKKIPSFVSLITPIVFNDSIRVKSTFNGLISKI